MQNLVLGLGFLLVGGMISIPFTAGRAGIPLIAGAIATVALTVLPEPSRNPATAGALLIVKGALYVVAVTLTEGYVTILVAVTGALDVLMVTDDVRPQALTCIAWAAGTYEIGVALINYIDGYPEPGHAIASSFTWAMSMLRGLLAFAVAWLSLHTSLGRYGAGSPTTAASTRETPAIDHIRTAAWASVIGYLSFWLILTVPLLLYGFGSGFRLAVASQGNAASRAWGIVAMTIAVLRSVLGIGVFDYAVLDGKYGAHWWRHLR